MQNANRPAHPLAIEKILAPVLSGEPARKIRDLISCATPAQLKLVHLVRLINPIGITNGDVTYGPCHIRTRYNRVTKDYLHPLDYSSYSGLFSVPHRGWAVSWPSILWEETEYKKITTNCFGQPEKAAIQDIVKSK